MVEVWVVGAFAGLMVVRVSNPDTVPDAPPVPAPKIFLIWPKEVVRAVLGCTGMYYDWFRVPRRFPPIFEKDY